MEEEKVVQAEATETLEHHHQHLPHDLVTQLILPKLPLKTLLNFKSVSKQWYSTLSSSNFTYTHFNLSKFSNTQFLFIQNKSNFYLYSHSNNEGETVITSSNSSNNKNLVKLRANFNDDDLVLIGSCNGLICLGSYCGYFFMLWNPIISKFREYFYPRYLSESCSKFRISWGFGYVSCDDDYKVVRVLELIDTLEIRVVVYSLRTNKWRKINDSVFRDILCFRTKNGVPVSFYSRQGVLADETLYWIVSDTNDWGRKIVAFDLVNEKFDTVSNLNLVSNDGYKDKFLCVMGGCLSKFGVSIHDDVYIDILKGPGKVKCIRLSKYLRLRSCQSFVGFTRNGGFFILLEDSTIGIVEPTSQPMKYKYTPLVNFECLGKSRVANYVPSLISPYSIA